MVRLTAQGEIMLIKQAILERIATGEVTLVFRRWAKPAVKPGGRLRTSVGELRIESIDPTSLAKISQREAKLAGFESLDDLRAELQKRIEGTIFRIGISLAGPDTRIALRNDAKLSAADVQTIRSALERLDQRASDGPWTHRVLEAIAQNPELKAVDLGQKLGLEKERLKLDVRKLKNLGLTESLHPGYRLSPRGAEFLKQLRRKA
jgi:hypothetical protein